MLQHQLKKLEDRLNSERKEQPFHTSAEMNCNRSHNAALSISRTQSISKLCYYTVKFATP